MERDPNKRRVKPVEEFFDLQYTMDDSSDDSDFKIEENQDDSDDISNEDSNEDSDEEDSSEDEDSDEQDKAEMNGRSSSPEMTVSEALEKLQKTKQAAADEPRAPGLKSKRPSLICCICLGDLSLDTDEVVECDGCGASVHEACYGIADTGSIASTVSSASTEPWFCEACRANVNDPECELCPNRGGIYKETDVGKWVHLVCALYVPGVAFGEVDKLSSVTLFEMSYSLWGFKECSLCEDERFSRTGVCISCDAGLCKTYFHVTCAQREGLLHDGHHDTSDQTDPFYAHCKLHSDKAKMRMRKRNWLALHSIMKLRSMELTARSQATGPIDRIRRKLNRQQEKYLSHKMGHPLPWVPTQKMRRQITSSPSAVRALLKKAELMELDTKMLETVEAQQQAVVGARKKWHIPPAFSVEFVSYYMDRNIRIKTMKARLPELLRDEKTLKVDMEKIRDKLIKIEKENTEEALKHENLVVEASKYHNWLCDLSGNPDFPLPRPLKLNPPAPVKGNQSSIYKAAQLLKASSLSEPRMSVSPVLMEPKDDVINTCFVCSKTDDQHLLVKCDTCKNFYHLSCLNPPLTRMPKKTKLYGWECSDCNPGSSSSDEEKFVDTTAPRQLRREAGILNYHALHNPDSKSCSMNYGWYSPGEEERDYEIMSRVAFDLKDGEPAPKKRKKSKKNKKKKEEKKLNSIKIKIKPPICPDLQDAPSPTSSSFPSDPAASLVVVTDSDSRDGSFIQSASSPAGSFTKTPRGKNRDVRNHCDACQGEGRNSNLVRCDKCARCFHWGCLIPPAKTNPKPRGFSWHCEECDSSDDEDGEEKPVDAEMLDYTRAGLGHP